jgi:hypothetical protein
MKGYMKKITVLLMAVSMVLASCGKLTGLLNGDKSPVLNSDRKTSSELPENIKGKPKPEIIGKTSEPFWIYKCANVLWEYKWWIAGTMALCWVGIKKGKTIAGFACSMIAPLARLFANNPPPANPHQPPANPYQPPANPYQPPANPYQPPANPYQPPPVSPYQLHQAGINVLIPSLQDNVLDQALDRQFVNSALDQLDQGIEIQELVIVHQNALLSRVHDIVSQPISQDQITELAGLAQALLRLALLIQEQDQARDQAQAFQRILNRNIVSQDVSQEALLKLAQNAHTSFLIRLAQILDRLSEGQDNEKLQRRLGVVRDRLSLAQLDCQVRRGLFFRDDNFLVQSRTDLVHVLNQTRDLLTRYDSNLNQSLNQIIVPGQNQITVGILLQNIGVTLTDQVQNLFLLGLLAQDLGENSLINAYPRIQDLISKAQKLLIENQVQVRDFLEQVAGLISNSIMNLERL